MTIICPACDARFRDPPADVPKNRRLQCGKCEHEWLPVLTVSPEASVVAPQIEMNNSTVKSITDALERDDEPLIRTSLPVVMAKPQKQRPAPLFVDREPEEVPKRSWNAAAPMAAIFCMALVTGSIIFKNQIMNLAPRTTAIYQAAGLVSKTPGLEIANVVTSKSKRDGINQLIVRGEIQNVANNSVPVPPLKVIMRGQGDSKLYAWTVSSTKPSLKAGEKSQFTAVAHDFPTDAVNVEVEFAPLAGNTSK